MADNGYFLPGWGWGIVAAVGVTVIGLMALPEPGPRPRIKSRGFQGYKRIRFWPSVDKARTLAENAQEALEQGDTERAREALREARTALKVASFYSEGPHTEQILRQRYNLVNDLEVAAGVWT